MQRTMAISVRGSEGAAIMSEVPRVTGRLDISELIDSFLAAQDVREISRTLYRKGLGRFWSWFETIGIVQPDRETILRFKTFLQECGLAANTINSYLVAVKRFFTYLEGMRLYPDVAKNIKGVQQPKNNLRESPTIAQVKEILTQIDTGTVRGKRDFAIVNVMARSGLRTIEIIRANLEDLRQEAGEALLYIQGKGRDSKDEFILLTEAALKPILEYLKERKNPQPDAPLFVSMSDRNNGERLTTATLRKIVRELFRAIGIDKPRRICAHSLRHFFATQALRAGAPLIQVRDALRHSSIETTQKYLHTIDRLDKAAERYINF